MKSTDPLIAQSILPARPSPSDLDHIVPLYEKMLIAVMQAVADRYERRPDYPFIDTKLDLITGADFPDDHPLGGPQTIYGFIQGRGLESVCTHVQWLRGRGYELELADRLETIARAVLGSIQRIRARNGGQVFFFMTPQGEPFKLDANQQRIAVELDENTPSNSSDLFCAKGMYAAARLLDDERARQEALAWSRRIMEDIWSGRFGSDQQSLDRHNPASRPGGRKGHGAYMLSLGMIALLVEHGEGEAFVDHGFRLMDHVIARHLNVNNQPQLQPFDYWEFIDTAQQPWRDAEGRIPSDPGHALEFGGFAFRFLDKLNGQRAAERAAHVSKREADRSLTRAAHSDLETKLAELTIRNFENGYNPDAKGICKSFDLLSRRPINSDMPWWNLPEAMRAAAYGAAWAAGRNPDLHGRLLSVLARCHNAFAGHYLRPELHYMAYQTRSATGEPIPVIPATADADPGYHTGLSIIDVLEVIGK